MLDGWTVRKIEKVFALIKDGDLRSAVTELETSNLHKTFSADLIEGFCLGLRSGDWKHLCSLYLNGAFLNDEGLLLWIAPYRQSRNGKLHRAITGVFGVAPIKESYTEVKRLALARFPGYFQDLSEIIGFRRVTCFGLAGGSDGEAFLVPNNWEIGNSAGGPALNDMTEQYARLRKSERIVRRLLDEQTADLVLSPVLDTIYGASLQNLEFQYHEVAHGVGLGFAEKMRIGLFKSRHNCAVEEWRSDGVSFSLMSELLDDEQRGKLVAANLALRLSVDALRDGGFEADSDARATALTLQDLLQSGAAEIADGKLRLQARNYARLAHAVDVQRERAWQVTRGEIDRGANIETLSQLYSEVQLLPATSERLRGLLYP